MPANAKASTATSPASGQPSPTPFAFFDPATCSWKTSPPCCVAGSTSSRPIWPRSGTTRARSAYAHPTSGPHTVVTGCSCWPPDETSSINTAVVTLPTPCARDGKGPGHQYGLPDLIEAGHHPAALLPTPTSTAASYGSNQSLSPGAAVRPSLATLAARLLPTPTLLDPTDATTRTDRHRDRDAPGQASADRRHVGSRPQALPPALLPTPRTSDARGPAGHGRGGSDLRTAMWELLPTPRASDGVKGCPAQRGSKGDLTLPSAAVRLNPGGRSDGDDRAGARLLPTPRVAATRTGRRAATEPDSRSGPSLEQAAEIGRASCRERV